MKKERPETLREPHEVKYTIENGRSTQIIQWLKSYCRPDPDFHEGIVSSIYFDSPDWRYLSEKINSDYIKTKVRIRWYSDLDYRLHSPQSFMELKRKSGSKRKKLRVVSPYSGDCLAGLPLEDPLFFDLTNLLYTEDIQIHRNLFPAFQVSYKRIRFIEPLSGTRLCFDFDIHAPRFNFHMLPWCNPFSLPTAVFELKGDKLDLPFNIRYLTKFGLRKRSFSKYIACYRQLTREI